MSDPPPSGPDDPQENDGRGELGGRGARTGGASSDDAPVPSEPAPTPGAADAPPPQGSGEQSPDYYFRILDLLRRQGVDLGALEPSAGIQPALTDNEETTRRKVEAEIGLKDQEVELRKQEVAARAQEVELRKQEVALRKQEIEQRAPYAKWAGIGMAIQLGVADVVFVAYAFGVGWNIPPAVISAWLASAVVEVIAVVLIITRNLFPNRDAGPPAQGSTDGDGTTG